ncbi:hypothetical protein C471_09405 [Halorubrum saccharovorum DSM 1137]|uniref:Uncharacterized protein n=1 Tax=Halorubrum saccharovorum DSM 1137 TaxID=1227484 RepID=M0DTD9_9EURY|nr:hypothetical protein [Halorubrum saccharovorum]ELZ38776.1 hypothetical protein C471_09405 [Halorubrum saccharovorum DSM 1137]
MTDRPPTEHASERSPKQLVAIAIVAFVAFPGTLTALGSGLVVLYASPPTLGTPTLVLFVTALTACTGATFLAHHSLR